MNSQEHEMTDKLPDAPEGLGPFKLSGLTILDKSCNPVCHVMIPDRTAYNFAEFLIAAVNAAPALQAENQRLRAALQSWLDWDDELTAMSQPDDPLTLMRQEFHGKRLADTRKALEGGGK